VTVSIIIVSYNAADDLERCLESLRRSPPSIAHDITVVDNASSDAGVGTVCKRWPSIQFIQLPENRGFAAGNNAGIRATRGHIVLLLNSDTIVPAGAIDTLADRLLAVPGAAAAGPRLVDSTGRAEISFGPMMSPFAELRQKATGRLYAAGWPPAVRWIDRLTHQERVVDWVSGACLMVHRADAEAVGLLDERFFMYTEDVDFCASLRRRGRQILYTPSATVTHLRGRSRGTAPGIADTRYRRSHLAFYEKHHPGWAPFLRAYLRLKGQLPGRLDKI
jgi:hypothetical protein